MVSKSRDILSLLKGSQDSSLLGVKKSIDLHCNEHDRLLYADSYDIKDHSLLLRDMLLLEGLSEQSVKSRMDALLRWLMKENPNRDFSFVSYEPWDRPKYSGPDLKEMEDYMNLSCPKHLQDAYNISKLILLTGWSLDTIYNNPKNIYGIYARLKRTPRSYIDKLTAGAQGILLKYAFNFPKYDKYQLELEIQTVFRYAEIFREVETKILLDGIYYKMEYPLHEIVDVTMLQRAFVLRCLYHKVHYSDIMRIMGYPDYRVLLPLIDAFNIAIEVYRAEQIIFIEDDQDLIF